MADFAQRDLTVSELMDDPGCDLRQLFNTYRQFAFINRFLSRWRTLYLRHLKPRMTPGRVFHVLDVGFGGGDIPRSLDRWARHDGLSLRVTAIEQDARALDFVRRATWPDTVDFQLVSTGELLKSGRRFDAVISNAVLHHQDEGGLKALLAETEALAEQIVIHNDLVRSRAAFILFSMTLAPWLRDSCAAVDGLRSIRRSFTPEELRARLGGAWRVESLWPYRQLVILER